MAALITPERFLHITGSLNPRQLAVRVYKKLQGDLGKPEETSNYMEAFQTKYFHLAFSDTKQADKILGETEARMNKSLANMNLKEQPEFRVLPPLFLVASERFIVRYNDVILFAFESGPIVPMVAVDVIKAGGGTLLEQLIHIYELNSEDYATLASIQPMLATPDLLE